MRPAGPRLPPSGRLHVCADARSASKAARQLGCIMHAHGLPQSNMAGHSDTVCSIQGVPV